MQQVLFAVIGYLVLLFAWGTICLVTYALSLTLKNKKPIQALSGTSQVVTYLLSTLFGLYLLYVGFLLLIHGQILWLILYIIVGAGLIGQLFTIVIIPFSVIPVMLGEHVAGIMEQAEVQTAEILDEAKNVIDISEGNKTLDRKLAIYFLIDYAVGLLYIVTHPLQYHMLGWWDYIITPIFFMLQSVIFIGIILLIYNKIRHHRFFYKNKKYWLIRVFQIDIILVIGMQAVAIAVLAILTLTR